MKKRDNWLAKGKRRAKKNRGKKKICEKSLRSHEKRDNPLHQMELKGHELQGSTRLE